jgi:hypothetical protein
MPPNSKLARIACTLFIPTFFPQIRLPLITQISSVAFSDGVALTFRTRITKHHLKATSGTILVLDPSSHVLHTKFFSIQSQTQLPSGESEGVALTFRTRITKHHLKATSGTILVLDPSSHVLHTKFYTI